MTRTYGTGTMSELRPGVWRFRVSVRDPITDATRQVSRTVQTKTRPSKRDLEAQLAAFRKEVEARSAGGRQPVGQVLDAWLADLERVGRAKSTLETYRTHVETRIRPALGKVRLDKMTPDRVRGFMGSLGGSPRTQRLTHAILRGAMAFAVKQGWLEANPVARVDPPRVGRDHSPALTPEQVGQLIRRAEDENPALGMAVFLAAVTGARRGEIVGLQWTDIDWKAQTMRVGRAMVPGQGGQAVTTTKTDEHRTVSLKGDPWKALKRWHASMKSTYRDLGPWLLSDSDGTEPLRAKTVTETFTRLAKELGIDVHFHDLRKFATTQLLGVADVKTISLRQGHSPEVLLDVYAKGVADRDAAASVALGKIVTKALPRPSDQGRRPRISQEPPK